jgi:hypothetical protein
MPIHTQTGKVLFTHNVGGPLGGGLVSYQAGGEQYVASVSGYVSTYNQVAPDLGGADPTITLFAAQLPQLVAGHRLPRQSRLP